MKRFINAIIFIFIIFAFAEYIKKENRKEIYKKRLDEYLQKKPNDIEQDQPVENKSTIYIRSLGNVDDGDLEFAADIVSDFYKMNVFIASGLSIPVEITNGNSINAVEFIKHFNDTIKTIYLTEYELFEDQMELRGYTTLYGKSIAIRSKREFMKETIKHEIGHTFGLEHCEDKTCIMAINNDEWDSGNFCENCKNKIDSSQLK